MRRSLFRAVVGVLALSLVIVSAQADTILDKLKKKGSEVEEKLKKEKDKLTDTLKKEKDKLTGPLMKLPLGLTEAKVKAHVLALARRKDIKIPDWKQNQSVRLKVPSSLKKTARPLSAKTLDVNEFKKAIHATMKDNVTGYMMQLRKDGRLVATSGHNWARTSVDGKLAWTEDTRMHIASVSKYLTAVGMVVALDKKGISYDAKIIDYLPAHWKKGKNIDKITFRHLLTHESGFATRSATSLLPVMKGKVAEGVAEVGKYRYENMNHGLCRILIPIVNGNVARNARFFPVAPLDDAVWDLVTVHHFKAHMQDKVFTPAGVRNAGFAPVGKGQDALAYMFPHGNKPGWGSGDLSLIAGGAGFRLSTKEVLNVMNHVRRKGTILSPAKAQMMLDGYFGIDKMENTAAGKVYAKNGRFSNGIGHDEQCVIYFLPNDMEVVVFVNSKLGKEDAFLMGVVKDAFVNNLK